MSPKIRRSFTSGRGLGDENCFLLCSWQRRCSSEANSKATLSDQVCASLMPFPGYSKLFERQDGSAAGQVGVKEQLATVEFAVTTQAVAIFVIAMSMWICLTLLRVRLVMVTLIGVVLSRFLPSSRLLFDTRRPMPVHSFICTFRDTKSITMQKNTCRRVQMRPLCRIFYDLMPIDQPTTAVLESSCGIGPLCLDCLSLRGFSSSCRSSL